MRKSIYRKILIATAISATLSGCAKDGGLATWSKCALIGGGTGGILGAIDSSAAAGWGALGGAALGGILCALKDDDSDNDGVYDGEDECPDTPEGVKVDAKGCPIDSDNDGVPDYLDKCPNTRAGMAVNAEGCPDSDGDGVPDNLDQCPNTPTGAVVDSFGCAIDSDGDGVPDGIDQCPNTPSGTQVDAVGCPLIVDLGSVYFNFDKDVLTPEAKQTLDDIALELKNSPNMRIKVFGYVEEKTKSVEYNLKLSNRRAIAATSYLVKQGVSKDRIDPVGAGVSHVGANTREGNRLNRRVDVQIIR